MDGVNFFGYSGLAFYMFVGRWSSYHDWIPSDDCWPVKVDVPPWNPIPKDDFATQICRFAKAKNHQNTVIQLKVCNERE